MNSKYKKAFSEIYEILKLVPEELKSRIPNEFYKLIVEEKDMEYTPIIVEPLENQKLMIETIIILGIIYNNFLSTTEEKELIKKQEIEEINEAQKILQEAYSIKFDTPKKYFNDGESNSQIESKKLPVTEENRKWYKKILNLIKRIIFNRKN